MSDTPERIWIEDEFGEGDDDQWTYGTWDVRNYAKYDVEYVRADTVQAQIDAAVKAERERCAKVAAAVAWWAAGDIAALLRKVDQP
jgi:hypothetical protein